MLRTISTLWKSPQPPRGGGGGGGYVMRSVADVVIPLEEAHLHSHSYRSRLGSALDGTAEEDDAQKDDDDDDEEDLEGNDHEHTGMLLRTSPSSEGLLGMTAAEREYTVGSLRKEVRRGVPGDGRGRGRWTDYEMKSRLVNKAIQDIGMGRYNWQLFVLCGFGWFADNLWMQGVSLTLPSLSAEFGISEKSVRYTTSSLYIGLCFGSFFWGIGSDIIGRRIAFNATLLITSIFGIASAWASTWPVVCLMYAALGFGVGGNLPVDGALFLEFLPDASSSLLTLLSVWWPIGQLFSSIVAWFFIAHWPADEGWRYFVFTIGIITFAMFLTRFFIFDLFESPKYLLSQGRQAEAVAVVHGIAFRNGRKTWLTEDILDAVANDNHILSNPDDSIPPPSRTTRLSTLTIIKSHLTAFSTTRLKPLFSHRKLTLTTILIWTTWATIGMGYPLFNAFLPQYLSHSPSQSASPSSSPYTTLVITSLVGIPGSLLAYFLVDFPLPYLGGRNGALATSTLVSALGLFAFAKWGTTPFLQLVFSCLEAFSQNIMYGVLYAFTPEIFSAPVRGAGTGVASFLNRIAGLLAPVVAARMGDDGGEGSNGNGPVLVAGGLILAAFGAEVGLGVLGVESRGGQRL
ncbi:major facilitator superfamily domain-containing protein [Apiosordaria backusii]|uniref:Major facilitator superfamily domain-containing protein n=1 Tax=Apiosordaria backusii TaxID=314023 RepID=A0AA40BK11_9PEZI|nr:major facilitator superfamily domain-containing protein [Apiosordaria backusii]